MLRFILVLLIVSYVIYKIGSFFFKAGAAAQQLRNQQPRNRSNGNARKKQGGTIKDGEYVDYEEIK